MNPLYEILWAVRYFPLLSLTIRSEPNIVKDGWRGLGLARTGGMIDSHSILIPPWGSHQRIVVVRKFVLPSVLLSDVDDGVQVRILVPLFTSILLLCMV